MSKDNTLLNGFQNFCDENYRENGLMKKLVSEGQKPDFLVVSCMDSRAAPETVFDLKPGTCFTHRPMGALVQPYDEESRASKELDAKLTYAIMTGITQLVIMAHTQCGAAEALVSDLGDPHIKPWLDVGKSALKRAKSKVGENDKETLVRETEKQIVVTSIHNIMLYPAVLENLDKIQILGWLFDMEHGDILELDPATGEFGIITALAEQEDSKHTANAA